MKVVQRPWTRRLWRNGFVEQTSFKFRVKIDGKSEDRDCDRMICARWGEPREWTGRGWLHEERSWFHGWGDAYLKERLVICNDEDTDQAVLTITGNNRLGVGSKLLKENISINAAHVYWTKFYLSEAFLIYIVFYLILFKSVDAINLAQIYIL